MANKPSFASLPIQKTGPRGNAWGLYGDNDEYGTLNKLTLGNIADAASREVRDGVRVSTDWPLNAISTPCFGRLAFQHDIKSKAPRPVNDDVLVLNTQSSSQWDDPPHYGYQKEKLFYNGKTQHEIETSAVNSIHAWVEASGIVGHGVLLDYATWAEVQGITLRPFESVSIPVSTLKEVAAAQGVEFRRGDSLLVRTGL
ncbi:hypothetical protein LRP88_14420 [Fusarium phalaenopsidis]